MRTLHVFVLLLGLGSIGNAAPVPTFSSNDFKKRIAQQSGAIKFPDKVQVGVGADQTRGQKIDVTFEEFTLTPLPKK